MRNLLKRISYILGMFIVATIFPGCENNETKVDKIQIFLDGYKKSWEEKNFETMYSFLSNESKAYITKDNFLKKYENVYSGINANNIEVVINRELGNKQKSDNNKNVDDTNDVVEHVTANLTMDTVAGVLNVDNYELVLVNENDEIKVVWNEGLIFPGMIAEDKVRVDRHYAERGQIFDRYNKLLAGKGNAYSIGIFPREFDADNKDEKIEKLAEVLDIDKEAIIKKLEANTNPEYFVEIVKVKQPDDVRIALSRDIDNVGILVKEVSTRIYPGGEELGRLIGHIRPITAEELKENEGKGYGYNSSIGKGGVEEVFEDTLRGEDGVEVYIKKADGSKVTLVSKEIVKGEDIKLTIDFIGEY